jgi:cytochrome c oxidase cbb3-type subunit 3
MNDDTDPLLMDHEADGIRELDNKLPRWWVWLFYGTTIFAIIYMIYYHILGAGDLMAAEYAKEMEKGEALKVAAMGRFESGISALQPSTDETVLTAGKRTYDTLCAPCHRNDGGGLVGPNLTDDYWIHGATFGDTVTIIWNGVPSKGMVTWKSMLKPDVIYKVASFVYTLRGTEPPNPKPPENQVPVQTGPSEFE